MTATWPRSFEDVDRKKKKKRRKRRGRETEREREGQPFWRFKCHEDERIENFCDDARDFF